MTISTPGIWWPRLSIVEICISPYVRFGLQTMSWLTSTNGAPAVGTGVRVGRGVGVSNTNGVLTISAVGVSLGMIAASSVDIGVAAVCEAGPTLTMVRVTVAATGRLATPDFKSVASRATC